MKFKKRFEKLLSVSLVGALSLSFLMPGMVRAESQQLTVTVDNQVTNNPSPEITGTVSDPDAIVSVEVDGEDYPATVDLSGNWESKVDATLTDGVYDVTATTQTELYNAESVPGKLTIDTVAPELTSVSIASNNKNVEWAKVSDTVTVNLTASEPLSEGSFTSEINGVPTTVTALDTTGLNFQFSRVMDQTDPEKKVEFEVGYQDLAGNIGEPFTNTTDNSSVTFDMTAPVLTEKNQNAMLQAENDVDGSDFYVVEKSGQVNLISEWVQLPNTENGASGTYTVKYAATDLAGNISDPFINEVNLTVNPLVDHTDESKAVVTLTGKDPASTKAGQAYEDQGVDIIFDGETYAHVWNSGDMNLSKVKKGYKLNFNAYTIEDPEQATGVATRTVNVTSISGVKDFYLVTGNKFVDLHWKNPVDSEFVGVNIYRSTHPGEAGEPDTLLYRASKNSKSYEDLNVKNGRTYYYVLKVVYASENGDFESASSKELTATPNAPKLVENVTSGSNVQPLSEKEVKKEVKSGNTDENKDETKNDEGSTTTLSMFGIGLLIILVLVGIYLLYVQNPEWFNWIYFWKKKKK